MKLAGGWGVGGGCLPTVKCVTPFLNGNQTVEENPKQEVAELLQVTVSILSTKGREGRERASLRCFIICSSMSHSASFRVHHIWLLFWPMFSSFGALNFESNYRVK